MRRTQGSKWLENPFFSFFRHRRVKLIVTVLTIEAVNLVCDVMFRPFSNLCNRHKYIHVYQTKYGTRFWLNVRRRDEKWTSRFSCSLSLFIIQNLVVFLTDVFEHSRETRATGTIEASIIVIRTTTTTWVEWGTPAGEQTDRQTDRQIAAAAA